MKAIENCNMITAEDVGLYLRLGGKGILDGLKGEPTKHDCAKILYVSEDGINVREFGRKTTMRLPSWNFNQRAELYTPAEIKKMRRAY